MPSTYMPSTRRRLSTLSMLSALGALSMLNACGFKLRGDVKLPFQTLWTNFSTSSTIGQEFKRGMRNHPNVKIIDQRPDAQIVLNILSESRDKVVLGVSSTGAIREYQLLIKLRFEILGFQGRELSEKQEISLKRDVTTNDAQVVAKEREDELLFREMQSDLVQQLMRRLSALKLT